MYPFTLWYFDNPNLDIYRDLYEKQLLQISEDIIPWLSREFLCIPDVSTMLYGYREQKISRESIESFLQQEWEFYISHKTDCLFSSGWVIIPGTDIRLTTEDKNPDNKESTHPDHKDTAFLGWWDIEKEKWADLYGEAFAILWKISPGFMFELNRMIYKIIPFGVSRWMHNSWSYSTCIWHLYMSYPLEIEMPVFAVLEAIIHESNHNKLNLIMKSDPLILNTREELYYSPYRPDARHIPGIYLWLHALVAVIYIFIYAHASWKLSLNPAWLEKSLIYHMKNALSLRVLDKYGIYTSLGKEILDEMRKVHNDTTKLIQTINIPHSLQWDCSKKVRDHFSQVQSRYTNLRY